MALNHFGKSAFLFWRSLLISAMVTGCSHPQQKFAERLAEQDCDQALDSLPENDPSIKLLKQTQHAAKSVISYGYIGANYTAEVLWDTVAGGIVMVALCSPAIALSIPLSAAGGGSGSGIPCFTLDGGLRQVLSPPLGRNSIRETEAMRCPDLTSLTRSVRGVAACFEARGNEANLVRAKTSLMQLQDSKGYYACVQPDAKLQLSQDLERLEHKLGNAPQ